MQITIGNQELIAAVDKIMALRGYVPSEDLEGRTIDINQFREMYCAGKSAEWVRTKIFDRYPETLLENNQEGGWVVNAHGKGQKTTIYQKKAAHWMEEHRGRIDLNEKL